MAKLALAVGDSILLGADLVLRLDRRAAAAAARSGGSDVLLYHHAGDAAPRFLGRGRVAELRYGGAAEAVECLVADIRPFAEAQEGSAELALPRSRAMLTLGDDRYAALVEAGGAAELRLGEAVAPFSTARRPHAAIYHQVLERWDFRCAMTGERFARANGRSGDLRVVAIRPRALDGPLHARNYLPLVELAAQAFQRGAIGVDADLNIAARQNALDPELLERMRPEGKLLVPADPDLGPDPVHLLYHWVNVFGRWAQSPLRE